LRPRWARNGYADRFGQTGLSGLKVWNWWNKAFSMMGNTNFWFISRYGTVQWLKPVVRETGFGLFYFRLDRLSPLRGPNLPSPNLPSPSPNPYFNALNPAKFEIGGLRKKWSEMGWWVVNRFSRFSIIDLVYKNLISAQSDAFKLCLNRFAFF